MCIRDRDNANISIITMVIFSVLLGVLIYNPVSYTHLAIYSIVLRRGLQVPLIRFCVSDRKMPRTSSNSVMDSFL